MAIAYAVRNNTTPEELYHMIIEWSGDMSVTDPVMGVIKSAASYLHQQGWVADSLPEYPVGASARFQH